MPRIRTLKPEHRQHRHVGPLSHRAYRLWVGMICEADDEGRLVAEPSSLRVTIFAYHPAVTDEDVLADLRTLESTGLVRLYRAKPLNGGSVAVNAHSVLYAWLPSWRDHQRIDKPKPSKLPAPTVHARSQKRPGTVADASQINLAGSEGIKDQGSRIGREGKGREREGRETPHVSHDTHETNGIDPDAQPGDEMLARALHITVDDVRQRRRAVRLQQPNA